MKKFLSLIFLIFIFATITTHSQTIFYKDSTGLVRPVSPEHPLPVLLIGGALGSGVVGISQAGIDSLQNVAFWITNMKNKLDSLKLTLAAIQKRQNAYADSQKVLLSQLYVPSFYAKTRDSLVTSGSIAYFYPQGNYSWVGFTVRTLAAKQIDSLIVQVKDSAQSGNTANIWHSVAVENQSTGLTEVSGTVATPMGTQIIPATANLMYSYRIKIPGSLIRSVRIVKYDHASQPVVVTFRAGN